jgi:outer membrane receptor protein involved in Fe transport
MCNSKIITSFLIILFTSCLYAGETGKIAGKVTDSRTNEPLIGANILIISKITEDGEQPIANIRGAATDLEGEYYILNIPPGVYNLKASFIGYQEQIITQITVDVDKTTKVDFTLSEKTYETEEVLVVAHTPARVERDLTATKQVYNVVDVQSIAGVADIQGILELQADVVDDHFRGGRVGESYYVLSGATIINPLNNQRAFSPIITGLSQVEVYTSGFSAEYGNAQSGVVNMVAKEGSNKWTSRFELSTTPPQYKAWGGSVYSPENLDFYNTLQDVRAWLAENPTQPGRPLWDAGYGFGSVYLPERIEWPPNPLNLEDSLKIARLGQILWFQSVRDVGLEYKNTIDYRFDFSTGGPLMKDVKIFLAGRQSENHPVVPTPYPDVSRQIMSNLTYDPDQSNKFKFRFIYDHSFENILNSNWLRWLFDRTFSISKYNRTTLQYGLDWQHVFNQSTFIDIRASLLNVSDNEGIELLREGQFLEDYSNATNWVDYTSPSNHRVGRLNDDRGKQNTLTYNLHSSLNSQIDKYNLVKAGAQFTYYTLEVNQDRDVTGPGSYRKVLFNAYPYEGAFYLQDKMEFEGFIANVGMRLDFYNMNNEFWADEFSPLRNPFYDPSLPYLERGQYYDPLLAAKERSDLYVKLQPRIGISFPVTDFSVFHLNYGTFTQRPSFNQIFYNQVTRYNDIEILGNPRLKPENTKAYDIGLVNSFPLGIRLDVSAYYKDVTDLVEAAYYYDEQQTVYQTYKNRDYADIKGFHVSVEKTTGTLKGYVRYNYESAKGKSSNALDAPVTYFERPAEGQDPIDIPDPEDIFLDYDRTHKAVFNLRYRTSETFGVDFGGFFPFGGITLSTTFRFYTGRPYTYDETGQGLKFNKRTPEERELRLRIEKEIPVAGNEFTVYAEGYNLLNEKKWHYSRTFRDERNTVLWEKDRDNILTYSEFAPYMTSQEVYLLDNQPRYFRFGIIYSF